MKKMLERAGYTFAVSVGGGSVWWFAPGHPVHGEQCEDMNTALGKAWAHYSGRAK